MLLHESGLAQPNEIVAVQDNLAQIRSERILPTGGHFEPLVLDAKVIDLLTRRRCLGNRDRSRGDGVGESEKLGLRSHRAEGSIRLGARERDD